MLINFVKFCEMRDSEPAGGHEVAKVCQRFFSPIVRQEGLRIDNKEHLYSLDRPDPFFLC